ncbi:hypothetical protein H4W26_002599 [Nesterenkonia halotolerans]|uniref:Uncharacterized protein n=1 Tax=Nesterenkonia halotolerans TaxID=225325 RepID=A0ABR9J9X9_9MICC|nr:hypothetical protein [Nesterenkonia halotolerans]
MRNRCSNRGSAEPCSLRLTRGGLLRLRRAVPLGWVLRDGVPGGDVPWAGRRSSRRCGGIWCLGSRGAVLVDPAGVPRPTMGDCGVRRDRRGRCGRNGPEDSSRIGRVGMRSGCPHPRQASLYSPRLCRSPASPLGDKPLRKTGHLGSASRAPMGRRARRAPGPSPSGPARCHQCGGRWLRIHCSCGLNARFCASEFSASAVADVAVFPVFPACEAILEAPRADPGVDPEADPAEPASLS